MVEKLFSAGSGSISPVDQEALIEDAIEDWIDYVRKAFMRFEPELIDLFETYAGEALFGRKLIQSDLVRLRRGARVLERGAGANLLSCQLVREGYEVTALEPIGDGFTHFERMKQLVFECARLQACTPSVINAKAENFVDDECYDFAFSINVMEHVSDPEQVIRNVVRSLVDGGTYHFTCPNYLFPYEPHFNIPTLFSKSLTEYAFREKIYSSPVVVDPEGTWRTLNWINVMEVRRIVKQIPNLKIRFNRNLLSTTIARIVTDQEFAARRSPAIRALLTLFVWLKLHCLLVMIPLFCQPGIDCRIEKMKLASARV